MKHKLALVTTLMHSFLIRYQIGLLECFILSPLPLSTLCPAPMVIPCRPQFAVTDGASVTCDRCLDFQLGVSPRPRGLSCKLNLGRTLVMGAPGLVAAAPTQPVLPGLITLLITHTVLQALHACLLCNVTLPYTCPSFPALSALLPCSMCMPPTGNGYPV